ncbi:MAG: penicillin-binding protein activator LpoB [Treponema sp.]|nr:penicillin-binding protein activator LpoB [Treponema sp.]
MKKNLFVPAVLFLAAALFSACSSTPKVDRVNANTQIDLSGRWNDTDVRLVSNSLINDCLNAPRVSQFIQQYMSQHKGNLPACLVGTFSNNSSEHIDTSILSKAMEIAIVNSGKMDFVAGGDTLAEIRNERQEQQSNASEDTAAALANEKGAALLLTGSVKSIVDRAGNTTVRSYFVSAELTNIETRTRLWMGDNNEIKKVIRQSNYKP